MRNSKGQFAKGNTPWSLTHEYSEETRKKMSISASKPRPHSKGVPILKNRGENNIKWKGDNAGYRALHLWVERQLGKAKMCQNNSAHSSTRYHWANVSGEYKRDISDWIEVCPSCNRKMGVKTAERFLERRVVA